MPNPPPFKTHGKRLILPGLPRSRSPPCKRWKPSDDLALADNIRLTDVPDDLLCAAFSFLDAPSLASLRGVNCRFRDVASRNAAGWSDLCRRLWEDKIHVLPQARQSDDSREAYRLSVQDARERDHVTREEMTYDVQSQTGTIWRFRFKACAGSSWTDWDPWYRGRPCRRMVFLPDGIVKEYTTIPKTQTSRRSTSRPESAQEPGQAPEQAQARASDGTHSQHSSDPDSRTEPDENRDETNTGAEFETRLTHPRWIDEDDDDVVLVDPPMTMTWRFLNRPVDLPDRPAGSYIRFTVGGRDVPTYCVRRSPTGNWGFVMESCWGVYASFELPKRHVPPLRRRRMRRRLRRAQDSDGNWFHVAVDEPLEEDDEYAMELYDEDDERRNNPLAILADDRWCSVTSGIQWREAFLYNFGARQLPEADTAADFERAYPLAGLLQT